ncbi:SPOR domain-containing protein [Emticicia sp.]|uniref:HU domain-containing protein n=1 Tax=Emticicia sp. TaxID=1930953 RepID=UPI00375245A0
MRPIADHIRTLLFDHDYVTIPNFGAFIANYMPSSFNEISGSLMPPQKRVAFNEILKQDDGLLATHISRRESVTIDEAKRKIQGFVTDIKDSLATEKSFTFDKIGNFSLNEENNLVFDPDRRNNFFSESFGFDSLFPRQITKEKYTYSQTFENDDDESLIHESSYSTTHRRKKLSGGRRSAWTYALYSFPILLLSSGLIIVLFSSPKNINSPAKASFNPLDYIPRNNVVAKVEKPITVQPINSTSSEEEIIKPNFETSQPVSVDEVKKEEIKKVVKTAEVKFEKVVEPSTKPTLEHTNIAININQKRYLIVSGVFKSIDNVEKLQSILQKNGFSPRIEKVGDLMKVIAGEANSYSEAVTLSEKHRALIGEKAAIIKEKH